MTDIVVCLYRLQCLKNMKGAKGVQSDTYKLALLHMQDALKERVFSKEPRRRMQLLTQYYKMIHYEQIKFKNRIYHLL